MFRNLLRLRFLLCLNLVITIVLAAAAQTQAQPGSGSSSAGNSPSKTDAVPPSQRVVLKVGNLQITQAAFEQYVSALEAQQGPADLSPKQLGDNYASMLMLSQLATANHLDTTPDVQRQLAIDRMQILSNAEFSAMKAKAKPTPEQIKAYYDAHPDEFATVEIRRLFVMSGDPANGGKLSPEQAKSVATDIRKIYDSGGDEAKIKQLIASTPHSGDEIVLDAQPLGFERGELPAAMQKTVFALKPGGWTEFDNSANTYIFVQLVQHGRRDLKDVSARIEKRLQEEKLRAELNELKTKTGIWMDESYFTSRPDMPQFQDRD